MRKQRRKFTEEYKAEAVRMVKSGDRKQVEVCQSLGLSSSTLSKWCGESEETTEPKTEESRRVKELEAEIRKLKLEQEILKKAAAYFARNQ